MQLQKIILVFCLVAVIASTAFSQWLVKPHYFEHVSDATCLLQDSRGFVWAGTENGLIKIESFSKQKTYVNKPSDSSSLSSNIIWCLIEDRFGFLWIGTENGLCRYNYKTDKFNCYLTDPSDNNSISGNQVMTLAKDAEGNIWAGVSDFGLNKMIQSENTNRVSFMRLKFERGKKNSFPVSDVWALAFDKDNYCYVGNYADGLIVFNAKEVFNKPVYFHLNADSNHLPNNNVLRLYFDDHLDGVWITGTTGMLSLVTKKNNRISVLEHFVINHFADTLKTKLGLNNITPYVIQNRSNNIYWLATDAHGLVKFQLINSNKNLMLTDAAQVFQHDAEGKESTITSLLLDKADNVWYGTYKKPLAVFNSNQKYFNNSTDGSLNKQLKNIDVFSLEQYKGQLIIGTNGSQSVFIWNGSTLKEIPLERIIKVTGASSYITYDILLRENGDLLLVGNYGLIKVNRNGLEKWLNSESFDLALNHIEYFPKNKGLLNQAQGSVVLSLTETPQKEILLGTAKGVFVINDALTEIAKVPVEQSGNNMIVRCMVSVGNQILIGADNGLFLYDNKNRSTSDFKIRSDQVDFRLTSSVTAIEKIDENIFLIASASGLYQIDLRTRSGKLLTLENNSVKGVLYDFQTRNIFASTLNGVYVIDSNLQIINYNTNDGLCSNVFNGGAALCMDNGFLVFGSVNGICRFSTQQLSGFKYKSAGTAITDFMIYKNSVLDSRNGYDKVCNAFINHKPIELSEREADVTVSFVAQNYLSEEKNMFQYRIKPGPHKWIDAESSNIRLLLQPLYRSIIYPGTYRFELRSRTAAGSWTYLTAPLIISVKPVLTKSIEFWSLVAILALSVMVYVVRYLSQVKLKQKLAIQEQELAIERERNRISRDLHDDLGAGLSSVAMMTNQIKELVTDEQAKDSAWEISNEANDLVSRMREIIWSMSSKNDTLENLFAYINKYSVNYLEKNYIQCIVTGLDQFPERIIHGNDRRNIFLVVKETLHNIVKHSGASEVVLVYTMNENSVVLQISDNGKGFDLKNVQRFGNGLINMEQRMQQANGEFKIYSEPGKGSTTTLTVFYK